MLSNKSLQMILKFLDSHKKMMKSFVNPHYRLIISIIEKNHRPMTIQEAKRKSTTRKMAKTPLKLFVQLTTNQPRTMT